MTQKKQINLRLDPDILARLEEQAKKEKRPRNNLLECIIIKYLNEQDELNKEE